MPVNQSNESDYGLESCLVPSPFLGTSIYGLSGASCSAGVRPPLFVQRDLHIGMASGTLRVLLICTILDNGMGRIPMHEVGTVLICGSRGPSQEGVLPRTLRTEVKKHKLS